MAMKVRFYRELWDHPTTRYPAIYGNDVVEREAYAVLAHPGEDLPGFDASRMALGQIKPFERYLRVVYVPEPDTNSAFVLAAFTLRGAVLRACRARQRSRGRHRRGERQRLQIYEHGSATRPWQDSDGPPAAEQRFPDGWDEERVRRVIAHYLGQSAEAQAAEDEAAGATIMTEAEWLACEDGWLMADQLQGDERQRKWELLAVACWRRYPSHLRDDPDTQAIIAVNEAAADGRPMPDSEWANADCLVLHWLDAQENALGCRWTEEAEERHRAEAEQARLVREVFGNPFRPSSLDPGCRTPAVTSLALAAYEQRDPASGDLDNARLAVLSDALEEADCDSAEILSHLRSAGPHVRGCWALDLILGKG